MAGTMLYALHRRALHEATRPLSIAERGRDHQSEKTSRRLVARKFGLVEREFLRAGLHDARALAHAVVIGLDRGPLREIDRRRRLGPVQDSDEVGVGDAEVI